ncbi:MAG: hypothetical protein ACM31O_16835 [Bacteroidota bacterium]|jgi:hypothetical protein
MPDVTAMSRREAMALVTAVVGAVAWPGIMAAAVMGRPGGDSGATASACLSPQFESMRQTMGKHLAAWQLAQARLGEVKAGYVARYVREKRRMGWYFNRPEVVAEQEARIRAVAAVERVFRAKAATLADIALQWQAIRVYETELGDDIGLARRHFGAAIASREREIVA